MQPQCKDEGKFASNVEGTSRDTLALRRRRCHTRRRVRLAGLQRPRVASIAHLIPGLMDSLIASFATSPPMAPIERAAGLPCAPTVVFSNNSEAECPDLIQRVRNP